MAYSDSVRKLHGKISIIYSDVGKVDETVITTSGNGVISHPNEVNDGYTTPTIKACTMDGHSKMDGSFKMVGDQFVVGWWSDNLSKSDGTFAKSTYMEMSFITRPMLKWIITGDPKLNQYPVNYDLKLYDASGTLLKTVEVRDNTEVTNIIKFNPIVVDVKKIRIDIYKWSVGNAKVKLIQFFDVVEETYYGDDLKQFDVVEEIASSTDGVYFGLCSNTMNVTLYNRDRKFDQGYLKDLLILDRKITPYIGIENDDGSVTYQDIGTFFSESWQVPQTDQWVKLKGFDRLMKFQRITYLGFPFKQNATLKEMFVHVIESAGIESGDYEIASELSQIRVPYAILGKQTTWDALQELCNAGLARVYFDRSGKLKVTVDKVPTEAKDSIASNRIFTFSKESQRDNFSNKIEVDYTDIVISESETESVYSNRISIDANSQVSLTVDYSKNVVDAYLSYLPIEDIELVSFVTSVNAGKFVLKNTTNSTKIVSVEIIGRVVDMSSQTITVEDSNSIINYGEMVYKHTGCQLIQTYARAVEIGEYLLSALNQNNNDLAINWRGDPKVKLEDKIECTDKYGNKANYTVHYNRFVFDGGLKQDTKGKEVKNSE